jgi:hypothetical protein
MCANYLDVKTVEESELAMKYKSRSGVHISKIIRSVVCLWTMDVRFESVHYILKRCADDILFTWLMCTGTYL